MSDRVVPLLVRAATNLVVEAGELRVSYKKGTPIDFHIDEAETPFLVWSEQDDEPDMSGSSKTIVNVVPSTGHVQMYDDPNPYVKIAIREPYMIQAAVDALTGAGISTKQKQTDLSAIWVKANVSTNAMTVLNAAGITGASRVAESVSREVKHLILVLGSRDIADAFFENVVLEEELDPNFDYENVPLIDLLVREGVSQDRITQYVADNPAQGIRENVTFRTLRVPIRRIRRRMSTVDRARQLIRMKENYDPGQKPVRMVTYIEADRRSHIANVGFFIAEDLFDSPVDEKAGIGRARSYLEARYGGNIKILSTKDDRLKIEAVKDVSKDDLVETMTALNRGNAYCFGMAKEEDNTYSIALRQPKGLVYESYYKDKTPEFLTESTPLQDAFDSQKQEQEPASASV